MSNPIVEGLLILQERDTRVAALTHELENIPRPPVRLLKTQPRLQAYDGSSGTPFPAGRFQWLLKQGLRSLNRIVDQRRLWYAN